MRFARLGVCVVDEQHRFGVEQRAALDAKGLEGMAPHVLHMTATPIPRTLSLTAYGDLDTTALRELPAGRRPVETRLVDEDERAAAYEFIRERAARGPPGLRRLPAGRGVREDAGAGGRGGGGAARARGAARLRGRRHPRPDAVGAEGRAMEAFVSGATDVLVATTVIEVGIDVPNATVMVIEGAERYGVSQLHQLRGRVGRGEHESHCLLFAEEAGELARRRLKAVARERDGFELAEVDLALRGEGEILGTRQHGLPRFAVAELPEDTAALVAARDEVLALLRRHGSLDVPALGPLLDAARRRFGAGASDPIPPMRVIAGELRGQRLVAPRGWRVRPTSDRVREAVFSALGDIEDARVLDLYCGTGALAIEALSRGAARAVLVDRDTRPALGNVERLGLARAGRAGPRRRRALARRRGRESGCAALRPRLRRRPL